MTTPDDDFDDLAGDIIPAPGTPWSPGETVTVLCPGMSINTGVPMRDISHVYRRSDVFTVTAATIEHQSWLLDLADDEDAQIERWGAVRLRRGTHEVTPWSAIGDPIWTVMHDDARRVALSQC